MSCQQSEAKYCVYCMTFPNGKKYVGQTRNLQNRWVSDGRRYKGQAVYNAIQKYGWNNVKREIVVDNLSADEIDYYERYYIAVFNTVRPNGYNISYGGSGEKSFSPETIERMRQSALGVPQSEEQRKKESASHKRFFEEHPEMREHLANKTRQYFIDHPEARENLRMKAKAQKRHTYTDEQRKRISDSHTKRAIIQLTREGEVVAVHPSVRAASIAAMGSVSGAPNIVKAAKGLCKSVYGFVWQYADKSITNTEKVALRSN